MSTLLPCRIPIHIVFVEDFNRCARELTPCRCSLPLWTDLNRYAQISFDYLLLLIDPQTITKPVP